MHVEKGMLGRSLESTAPSVGPLGRDFGPILREKCGVDTAKWLFWAWLVVLSDSDEQTNQ
jgi:hypothetical protein